MFSHNFYDKNRYDAVIAQWGNHVVYQSKSRWIDGKIQMRPNALAYVKYYHKHSPFFGFENPFWNERMTTANVIRPDGLPISWDILSEIHRSIIVETGNKFHDEVGGIRVNLLDIYRTRIEAMNMVTKNANKLVHAYKLLKKGKWRQFTRTLGISSKRPKGKQDNIPALWLEYSFGWAPLISDIYTMLDDPFEVPSAFVRKVFRNVLPYEGEAESEFERVSTSGTITCRGVAVSHVYVDVPAMKALSSYGITNPTAVAWEAVPFSFVVDWFAPVGDYLNSLGALAGLRFKDYNITSTITVDLKGNARKRIGPWDSKWASGNLTYHIKSKNRAIFVEPEWIYPGNSTLLDLSLRRTSYALSLLAVVFGSKR